MSHNWPRKAITQFACRSWITSNYSLWRAELGHWLPSAVYDWPNSVTKSRQQSMMGPTRTTTAVSIIVAGRDKNNLHVTSGRWSDIAFAKQVMKVIHHHIRRLSYWTTWNNIKINHTLLLTDLHTSVTVGQNQHGVKDSSWFRWEANYRPTYAWMFRNSINQTKNGARMIQIEYQN